MTDLSYNATTKCVDLEVLCPDHAKRKRKDIPLSDGLLKFAFDPRLLSKYVKQKHKKLEKRPLKIHESDSAGEQRATSHGLMNAVAFVSN